MQAPRSWPMWFVVIFALAAGHLHGQPAFSTSFEKGVNAPDGWRLEYCPGKWEQEGHTGARSVSVTGDGKNHGRWGFAKPPLEPNQTYRFSVWYKSKKIEGPGHNSVNVGIESAFKRYEHSPEWRQAEQTFRTPADGKGTAIRLSHFCFNGTVWFDDVSIEPVKLAYFERDGIALDGHERIEKGTYIFEPNLNSPFTNCYRVTEEQTVVHHENRMWFSDGKYLLHKYQIGDYRQLSAQLFLTIGQEGVKRKPPPPIECKIEASKDSKTWKEVGRHNSPGDYTVEVPKSFFPAKELFVRVTGTGSFQVKQYRYSAELDGSPPDREGSTEAFRPNHALIDNGVLRLVLEEGEGPMVSIRRREQAVGRVECLLAQFEKKGLGYKRTGIGLVPASRVKSFTVKEKEQGTRVAEVVVEQIESAELKRRFEVTYRLTLPDNEPWFECRLISVKNTDSVDYKIIGYDDRLQAARADMNATSFGICAAWFGEGEFLAALVTRSDDFLLGFRKKSGDITRRLDVDLPAGKTWTGEEPDVVIYVGGVGLNAFVEETSRIRKRFGLPGVKLGPTARGPR